MNKDIDRAVIERMVALVAEMAVTDCNASEHYLQAKAIMEAMNPVDLDAKLAEEIVGKCEWTARSDYVQALNAVAEGIRACRHLERKGK